MCVLGVTFKAHLPSLDPILFLILSVSLSVIVSCHHIESHSSLLILLTPTTDPLSATRSHSSIAPTFLSFRLSPSLSLDPLPLGHPNFHVPSFTPTTGSLSCDLRILPTTFPLLLPFHPLRWASLSPESPFCHCIPHS